MQIRCPHCQNAIELVDDSDFQSVDCPSCGSQFGLVDVAEDASDRRGTIQVVSTGMQPPRLWLRPGPIRDRLGPEKGADGGSQSANMSKKRASGQAFVRIPRFSISGFSRFWVPKGSRNGSKRGP